MPSQSCKTNVDGAAIIRLCPIQVRLCGQKRLYFNFHTLKVQLMRKHPSGVIRRLGAREVTCKLLAYFGQRASLLSVM